ncbi:MAG: trigger factor [Solirubrobacterales bacterium]|nr:trigger factor [Solirubrobacterales bacterium]
MTSHAANRPRVEISIVVRSMKTTVTELSDTKVRIDAEIPADELEARIKAAAARLGQEMKISGFREGKVPPEMVLQRVGREPVLTEAIESSIAEWYEAALIESGINPVGDPSLKIGDLPAEAEPLTFSIEVGVRPKAELGDYKGLEVGREEVEVPTEAIDAEIERLRTGFAKLNPVDREATEGDVLLVDFDGKIDGEPFEGGEARDYLLELGSGQVLEGFEKALAGAKGGETRTAEVDFPDDYGAEEMQGKKAEFDVTVKEVREKELPDLDDDFAAEASEFDTLDELRDAISGSMKEILDSRVEEAFREKALDAAVDKAKVDIPDELLAARAEETLNRAFRQLQRQGVDPERYLQLQGKTREELVTEARPEAERSLKREAVLAGVADAENIEISEDEMLEALKPAPGHEDHGHPEPAEALKELKESGRDQLLVEDLRLRRALDVIAENATPIAAEAAEAREKIWTPEKEREEKGGLWTPGDPKP